MQKLESSIPDQDASQAADDAPENLFEGIRTPAGHTAPEQLPPQMSRLAKLRGLFRKNQGLILKPAAWAMAGRLIAWRVCTLFKKPAIAGRDHQVVIACHHKVMTTYFTAVLTPLCWALHLRFVKISFGKPPPDSDICLSMQSSFNLNELSHFRGIHVIRDPRDMIVSGFHYHKWTHENWVHLLDDQGLSYQQKLNEATQFDGLFMEIDHFLYIYGRQLTAWDTDNPMMFEVSFESLLSGERESCYEQMFRHLGFTGKELNLCIGLMRLFEAGSRTRKKKNAVSEQSHIRSASSGQWQNVLNEEHAMYIERYLGPVLRKFGYEDDGSWVDVIPPQNCPHESRKNQKMFARKGIGTVGRGPGA